MYLYKNDQQIFIENKTKQKIKKNAQLILGLDALLCVVSEETDIQPPIIANNQTNARVNIKNTTFKIDIGQTCGGRWW